MSPEAEELFEQQLSYRNMATSVTAEKLPDCSEHNSGDRESDEDEQNKGEQPDELSNLEVWEDDDLEESQNMESFGNTDNAIDRGNTTCTDIITALSVFILLWQKCFSVSGVAISALLKFFKMMFVMIGDITGSNLMKAIGNTFPISLQTIKRLLGFDGNAFKIYAVCPKCNALYIRQTILHENITGWTCC
jgi:hypothetical protein